MLTIIFSIITIILGVGGIVLFTQPAFGIYNFNGEGTLEGYTFPDGSLFDLINFESGQHAYLTVVAVALILAIVLLLVKIDGRLALLSFFFFSFLSVAAILALPVLLSKKLD